MIEEFVRDNNITLTNYLVFALPFLAIVLMLLSIKRKPAENPPVLEVNTDEPEADYQIMPKSK